jgi:hypothetical protein
LIANLADEGVEAKEEIREPLRLVVLAHYGVPAELTIDGRGPARGVSGDATGLVCAPRARCASVGERVEVGDFSGVSVDQRGRRRERREAGPRGLPGFLDGGGLVAAGWGLRLELDGAVTAEGLE